MLNILYNITILESSISFYYDHMTVIVLCDCDVTLDSTSRSPSIKKKKKKIKVKRNWIKSIIFNSDIYINQIVTIDTLRMQHGDEFRI